jgi:hypothetical protein
MKALEAAKPAVPEGQLDAKGQLEAARDAYEDALLDGDRASIKAARKEMDAAQERYFDERSASTSNAVVTQTEARELYNVAVSEIETAYPVLNPDSPDFDEAVMGYASSLMKGLVANGLSHVEALAESAELTALKFKLERAEAVEASRENKAASRKASAVTKAVEAATRQAPAIKAGADHDTAGGALTAEAIAKMSNKQFDKIAKENPEALARARGDIF